MVCDSEKFFIQPPPQPLPDVEFVASCVHDAWVEQKVRSGISSRILENGEELMVPYFELSEKAKDLDRVTVKAVYKAILQAGM